MKSYTKKEISEKRLNPTEEQEGLVREVYERFSELKRAKMDVAGTNIEDIWDQNEKNLVSYADDLPDDDDRSNLFIPITHSTIDTIMSEWIRQHSSGRVVPSEDPEAEPKAQLVDFCVKHIERKNNIEKVDMDTHYDTVGPIGNGIQMIYYKSNKRKIRTISNVNKDGTKEYKETIKDDFDDICIERINPRMIFPDSAAKEADFSDSNDVILRKIMTYSQFEIEYDGFENTKYVKRGGDVVENDFFEKPKDMDDSDVEVLMWWNKGQDFLRQVANGILIEDKPMPYDHKELPFVGTYDIRRPGQFWNISTVELMASLQDEYNSNRNIRNDAQKLSTLKMYWVPSGANLEDDEIIAEAGRFYKYQGNMPPTPIEVGTDLNASYMSEDRMKDDVVTTTGVDRKPESEGPNETATSVAVKREATMKRIARKIRINQILLEKRRGDLLVALIMQYYTTHKLVKVAGKEEVEKYQNDSRYSVQDDGVYEKRGRKIRVDGKDIKVKTEKREDGEISGVKLDIKEKDGYTFFNTSKELISGKYEYVIVPDIDIPTTRAQEVEIATMLYDRLISNPVINSHDGKLHIPTPQGMETKPMPKGLVKITENLLNKHGHNIQDYMPDEAEDDAMAEQAMKENVAMLQGMQFGPTPLASPVHTQVHNQFMEQNVDESDPELAEVFNNHIMGEIEFQKNIAREQKLKSMTGERSQRGPEQTQAGGARGNSGV